MGREGLQGKEVETASLDRISRRWGGEKSEMGAGKGHCSRGHEAPHLSKEPPTCLPVGIQH